MFSYNEYKNIIQLVKTHLPIMDFSEIKIVNRDFKFKQYFSNYDIIKGVF